MTKLTHMPSGQWQSSFIIAPLPKNDPQGMGSALTYCHRYTLTAMLRIVTEDKEPASNGMLNARCGGDTQTLRKFRIHKYNSHRRTNKK